MTFSGPMLDADDQFPPNPGYNGCTCACHTDGNVVHVSACCSPLDERPSIPCDKCKKPSTRWFKGTSVALCDSPECYDHYEDQWNNHIQEQESNEVEGNA